MLPGLVKRRAADFNPRLPFLEAMRPVAGRYCTGESGFNPRLPFWEAMRLCAVANAFREHRFNPRLPFLGGDALQLVPELFHGPFQSTPPISGRRASGAVALNEKRFQSRLPFLGGDASLFLLPDISPICFNPRLPFLGGDAGLRHLSVSSLVSIHASHFWEAMLIKWLIG